MNKILLIIQREYLSRVKKKSFILMTFLLPLLIVGMYALTFFIMTKSDEIGDKKRIQVVDESGLFINKFKETPGKTYTYTTGNYAEIKSNFLKSGYNYLLHIPASLSGVEVFSEKKPSGFIVSSIEDQVNEIALSQRLRASGIDTAVLAKARSHVSIDAKQITEKGEKDAESTVATIIGLLCGFLIYFTLFIYSGQVMRGVIEEKTSRVIEVIISSVRPFQLMLGKIIGVGMVGLTQFLLWIILTVTLTGTIGTALTGHKHTPMAVQMAQQAGAPKTAVVDTTASADDVSKVFASINHIPLFYTIGCFLFYFLFGYFLYSAIFAAVGSAVDSETETQQFMLPITMPLIFTFVFSTSFIISNPDSSISVWLSLIPFTSPIAMMVRIPFGVPAWQLALSMFLMICGFIFTTWFAGRIYRVGILMYGKKVSYKELAKWFMYKE